MTDDPRTICKRCGFANIPGDQFCGSCGAFLEWEGQPGGSTGAPGAGAGDGGGAATPGDAAPTGAGGASGAAAWGAPYGDPIPTPVRPAAPDPDLYEDDGDGIPDGSLVRCPACGIANPSNRTFCQSCGTTLAAAERVTEPPPEQVAEAVAWTPTPPPSPVVGAKTRGGSSGARGIPGWVLGVAVVGLLVGVAVVLAGLALRGSPPDTGSQPSGAAPSGATSSAAPGASPSAGAGSPGVAGTLTLTGAKASSVANDLPRFQPAKAIDGDLKTSWQEGKGAEKNQWIQVAFDPARADRLVVRNGNQASTAAFKGYRRLKDILVTVGGGKAIAFRLKDTMKAQQIDLGGVAGATVVRITIVSTYAGQATSAANTPTDDAGVSEISVLGVPGG